MANPTSNFGWQMPTSTDLVTDLPADFETFGQAVDTSMADLKGGTTGQILSKASGTDMDFTWITNVVGDITAVTAGTGISGGGTSGDVTITNSMATAIDAKGDLIGGTGADTFSRLAVGTNGQVLTADSTASTGLAWATPSGVSNAFFAGKNKIINGDFYVNQRNFSSTTTSDTYGFDRWYTTNSDGTVTSSAQTFTAGTAPVAGYEGMNYLRQVTTGQTAVSASARIVQGIENVRTLAGQTATLSFWAKAASGTPKIAIELTQAFGSGGSPSSDVNTYAGQVTLSTSWARVSVTVAIPSISGKTVGTTANTSQLLLRMWTSAGTNFNSRTGSLGIQSNTFDIWGVQLEAGSTATDFQTATGTIQGELAACQRYYQIFSRTALSFTGMAKSTTTMSVGVQFVQTMRTAPTVTLATAGQGSGQISFLTSTAGYPGTTGTHTVDNITVSGFDFAGASYSASFTAGNATLLYCNGTSNIYTASSEL